MARFFARLAGALALATPMAAVAKPIAYADGYTVMAEYGADTMREAQAFYAPRFDRSFGGGWLRLDADGRPLTRRITYARFNYLVRRWNLPDAQGNVFAWGGLGGATGNTFRGARMAGNVGAQADYETRRIYASLRTDWHKSAAFDHRIDTLQLGLAPYPHEYDRLATWFVVQARDYSGGLHEGIEWAGLLRLFKGGAWVEAGVTDAGKLQVMAMFNF
jgi:hypothetical protein